MAATLIVSRREAHQEFPLNPLGTTIGRSPDCDIVLDSSRVSRKHARLFLDPFDRWIIEDLDSTKGTFVNGQRVDAHALLPGEEVTVGPYSAELAVPMAPETPPESERSTSTQVYDEHMEILQSGSRDERPLTVGRLKELNRLTDRLSSLPSGEEVYRMTCRLLCRGRNTASLILRLDKGNDVVTTPPSVLAGRVAGSEGVAINLDEGSLRLSRRVLEAVRTGNETVMAKSVPSFGQELTLTVLDEQDPRAVLCAPIRQQRQWLDVIYLDVPLKQVSEDAADFLQAIAHQVRMVRESLLLGEMRARRQALDRELAMAREIQSRLTPTESASVPGVEVAIVYEPAMWVGGDYCDTWVLPDGRFAFAVADVCGKGLPAAMVMSNLHAALRTATTFCSDLGEVIARVNQHLAQHLPEGMFVTLFFGVLTAADGSLQYINAGHVLPLLIHPQSGAAALGRPSHPVLGIMEAGFAAETQVLEPGTTLLTVTDGITEAQGPDEEQFGPEGLLALAQRHHGSSPEQLVKAACSAAADFRRGRAPQDDVTVLAVRYTGPVS